MGVAGPPPRPARPVEPNRRSKSLSRVSSFSNTECGTLRLLARSASVGHSPTTGGCSRPSGRTGSSSTPGRSTRPRAEECREWVDLYSGTHRQIARAKQAVASQSLLLFEAKPLESAGDFVTRIRPNLVHTNGDWLDWSWSPPGLMDTIRLRTGECHDAENEEPLPT